MIFYHWEGKDLILSVHIQPRANQTLIVGVHDNRLKVKITAAPVDGQANADMCKLLSKIFGVAKSQITIRSGYTSRNKLVCIKSPKKLPEFIAPSDRYLEK